MNTFNKEEYTEKHMKLKLHPNEVVKPESFIEACLCCELADSLGFAWSSSERYLKSINYDFGVSYNFREGSFFHLDYSGSTVKISAIQFLNRHDIFVHEQTVLAFEDINGRFLCGAPESGFVLIDGEVEETSFESPFHAFEPRIKENEEPESETKAINPTFTKYSKLRAKFMDLAKEINELTSVISDYEKE